jgi:P27 family predicted phage terminase small subunit
MPGKGPPRTPTAILKARGSWRAAKRVSEPQAELGRPECPSWLRADAKRKWKQLVPLLEGMGILAKVDGDILAQYCQLWARWKAAEIIIAKRGMSEKVRRKDRETGRWVSAGYRAIPEVKIASDLSAQLARLYAKLGLSPADRAGLSIEKDKEPPTKKRDGKDKNRFLKLG